jgi:uncharacterized integral membrane protein
MKNLALLFIALIIAFWISAIALISIQNAEPVTLKFLTLQSVALPFGLVLAFSAGLGVFGSALLLPLLFAGGSNPANDDDDE